MSDSPYDLGAVGRRRMQTAQRPLVEYKRLDSTIESVEKRLDVVESRLAALEIEKGIEMSTEDADLLKSTTCARCEVFYVGPQGEKCLLFDNIPDPNCSLYNKLTAHPTSEEAHEMCDQLAVDAADSGECDPSTLRRAYEVVRKQLVADRNDLRAIRTEIRRRQKDDQINKSTYSDFDRVLQGLLILYPHSNSHTTLFGQADSIIVHGMTFSPDTIGSEDAKRLEQLGWTWDLDGWSWQ